MPAVIHTGFPSGYPPFVLISNDVLFASSYFYESGGSVSAYAADCGSDQPCPLLWSHRFGTDEYLAGPVLASPSNTSIFIVTTDKTGARLYAFAPGTIQPNGS